MRRFAILAALSVLFLAPSAEGQVVDLLAQAPFTTSARLDGVSPGSPLAASGRGADWQPLKDGRRARVYARRSAIDLVYRSGEGEELILVCAAPESGQEGLRASILLNGRRLGIVRFFQALEIIRFPLDSRRLRPGRNRLEIKKGKQAATSPADPLVCDYFGIGLAGAKPLPAMGWEGPAAGGALVVSAGESFEIFVRHTKSSRLLLQVCDGGLTLTAGGVSGTDWSEEFSAGAAREIAAPWATPGFAGLRLQAGSEGARVCAFQLRPTNVLEEKLASEIQRPAALPRNVLLIVVDTLRADRLGAYGGRRGLTPAIDALAAEGIVFENTVAQSAWTSPATASILTGTEPTTHGVRELGDTIAPTVPALATLLGSRGFSTAAITTNINVRAALGFERGFDKYRYLAETESRDGFYASADEVRVEAIDWLDTEAQRPFFLYLHLSEPHAPYAPSAEAARQFVRGVPSASIGAAADPLARLADGPTAGRAADLAWVRSLYDAEVATLDRILGQLRQDLEARGLWETTLVVLTSDHGEAFGEHGFAGHGYSVFAEEVQVPLIFRWGGAPGKGQRAVGLARQIDILPTILDLLGGPPPAGVDGVSLVEKRPSEAFTETRLHRLDQSGLILNGFKVVVTQGRLSGSAVSVYDLDKDPGETTDVAPVHPAMAGWATQEFRRREDAAPQTDQVVADPLIGARLKMLGYLE